MSRSYRKKSFCGFTTSVSEKRDKKNNHKRVRRKNKVILQKTLDEDQLLHEKEITNVWDMSKDGKQRFSKYDLEEEYYKKLMRK